MKKALKIIGLVLLGLVVVIVAAVLALPLWIGPVAKGVANSVVPGITGTAFNLGDFGLNPYTGALRVGDVQLANPTNYSEKNAVDLKSLKVKVEMGSLGADKLHVESVDLDGLVVYSAADAGNFMQIAENASGGKAPEGEASVAEPTSEAQPSAKPQAGQPAAQEKKGGVVIDRITLKNITVKYGVLPIPVPEITLTDIGKEKPEGASWADVWNKVFGAVMGSAKGLGDGLKTLGSGAADLVTGAGAEATGALKNAGAGAKDALKDAGKELKNLFK